MSHGIMKDDSLFVVGKPSWHGLAKVLVDPQNSDDAIIQSGLDWIVEPVPLYAGTIPVPKMVGLVRSDTKAVLGTTSNIYKIYQNKECFSYLDDIMGLNVPVKYESAGSLFGGKKTWMLARIPDTKIFGDTIMHYMFFVNSFTGKSSCSVGITDVRFECNNTLTYGVKTAPRKWNFQHKGDLESKKIEAMKSLKMADSYIKAVEREMKKLAVQKINASKLIKLVFPISDEMSERIKGNNQQYIDSIMNIHDTKPDLANFRNTAYGLYQAVADWKSNSEPLRKTDTYEENKFEESLEGIAVLDKVQAVLQSA